MYANLWHNDNWYLKGTAMYYADDPLPESVNTLTAIAVAFLASPYSSPSMVPVD